MEQIADVARRALSREYEQPTQPTQQPTRIIDRLWERMTEIYGHRWVSSYGPEDSNGTWAAGLADMSANDIKRGFLACLTSTEGWPPTLPEFRVMCRPALVSSENSGMYALPACRQLPHMLSDESRQKGRKEIAKLRGTLRRAPTTE